MFKWRRGRPARLEGKVVPAGDGNGARTALELEVEGRQPLLLRLGPRAKSLEEWIGEVVVVRGRLSERPAGSVLHVWSYEVTELAGRGFMARLRGRGSSVEDDGQEPPD